MTRNVVTTAAIFVAFASGLVMSRVADPEVPVLTEGEPVDLTPAAQTRTSALPAAAALPDLTAVADRAIQASVNISSTEQVSVADPFFQLFYGRDAVRSQTSLGSGVFVSADGYVVTNSHVVGSARADIKVTTNNRELPAKVVGIDPVTDLAVLKIDIKGGSPLPWGDSSKLRVAEWVLAVGNPFQFNQSVTLGIVSAQNRHDPQLASYNDFIQHDAAINPGNSGGALVTARGELVGINTMIAGDTGGYQGLSFAIPANLARRILDQLIKEGEVVRGSIGNLAYRTITAEQARGAGLGSQGGAFVDSMYQNDPAYLAGRGIRPRDIIISFNGTPITDASQLQRLIADTRIGSTARIEVIRRGARQTFEVPIVRMTPHRRGY